MPGYAYLFDALGIRRENAVTTVRLEFGRTGSVSVPIYHAMHGRVDLYLIGAGDRLPYSLAFQARDRQHIYDTQDGLDVRSFTSLPSSHTAQWADRDAFFSLVSAKFTMWLHRNKPLQCVHLHGATNALTGFLIKELSAQARLPPIAIVYTLHDYLDETRYYLPVRTLGPFFRAFARLLMHFFSVGQLKSTSRASFRATQPTPASATTASTLPTMASASPTLPRASLSSLPARLCSKSSTL